MLGLNCTDGLPGNFGTKNLLKVQIGLGSICLLCVSVHLSIRFGIRARVGQMHYDHLIITHIIKVCHSQHLTANSHSQGHNFDSNSVSHIRPSVTIWICILIISPTRADQILITSLDYYSIMKVCCAQHLATNSKGQGHNFDARIQSVRQ